MNKYVLIKVLCVIVSAFSQMLLKKSADSKHKNIIGEYLNVSVIVSYAIFAVCVVLDTYTLKGVSLGLNSIIESLNYVLVPILGVFLLKEKLNKYQIIGIIIIFVGVVVFNI